MKYSWLTTYVTALALTLLMSCGGGGSGSESAQTFGISGTVTVSGGNVLSGVSISLTGASTVSTISDASGNYSFTGLSNGSYTVTPSLAGYTFSPTSIPVTVGGANSTGNDFTATAVPTFTISGSVSGAVLQGVTIALSGSASTTTISDASGNYSFTGLSNGSYTVTPSLAGYTFSPTSISVTVSSADSTANDFTSTANAWTWVSGANTIGQKGVYGTKGTTSASNVPGGRYFSVSWIDSSRNLWLFGGGGYDSAGTQGNLNDLWKFDGTNWTWVSGANIVNQTGVYGTKGTPSASNMPGARFSSVSWIDGSGNLWLFGGQGYDSTGTAFGYLNDLWEFDGSSWTWVSGANTVGQTGVYGTKGTPAASNVPGGRYGSASWIDGSGNLWLFGGVGYDSAGAQGSLNDLWKFDGTNWTWVSGAKTWFQMGVYGTKGTPAASNVPGARYSAISWIDGSGNLWLFGGWGYDSAGTQKDLNDLWKFDGTNWTWVSGANTVGQTGIYGTKGTASASNVPGARYMSLSWTDSSENFWLFGGYGYDAAGTAGDLNDLWKFDGSSWTWVSGANTVGQNGVYGTKGTASPSNVPGARASSVSWIDSSGNRWLFGGFGYDSAGAQGILNDLWRVKLL